ncbi:M56 family metallopeptidase [Oscillibacter sp. MSJ-2]|uniref:M56 family metallopeptidase n=1 Tax=Dysosmobacter acutus TaxID=2841504 RepID=A0ABS6F7Q6_9FIRM|nr:M56 family metallopeptidase [Dysosmobacter acutus]MBU5626318.1 M56 family metallopeptidase [Dysosmobacter acutus]
MWMDAVFSRILDMSLAASPVILAVALSRLLLKRAPKLFSHLLWAVVLFRLLCPVSFSSPISLFNAVDMPVAVHELYPEPPVTEQEPQSSPAAETEPSFFSLIWALGVSALLICSALSLWRLRRTLTGSVHVRDNLYSADHIHSAFVVGLFRPVIYLPSALSEQERSYIILHEQTHIRRHDHIVKLLAFLALTLHWFNPLVWLAFTLSERDMEMSCDEAVLQRAGVDIRADYSASLLKLAAGSSFAAVPLAFGEGDVKGRIKHVMRYRTPSFWIVFPAAAAAVAVIIAVLITNPIRMAEQRQIADAAKALVNQGEEDAVVAADVCGDSVVLLTESRNPEDTRYVTMYTAYILDKSYMEYGIAARYDCEPARAPGFHGAVLHGNGVTAAFGSVNERYWDYRTDEVRQVRYTRVTAVYDGGEQSVDLPDYAGSAPFLIVIDGTVDLRDLRFYEGEEQVASYVDIYDAMDVA